jgi:hypothetical protein
MSLGTAKKVAVFSGNTNKRTGNSRLRMSTCKNRLFLSKQNIFYIIPTADEKQEKGVLIIQTTLPLISVPFFVTLIVVFK